MSRRTVSKWGRRQNLPEADTSPSTVFEEAVYLTAEWQRRNLKLDESVRQITEGKLSGLK